MKRIQKATGVVLSLTVFILLIIAAWFVISIRSIDPAPTIIVSNTLDNGIGSLRQAILDANAQPGPNTIAFAIPDTDPGFVAYEDDGISNSFNPLANIVPAESPDADPDSPRWWRIPVPDPDNRLPIITDSETILDGTSQTLNQGDTNIYGPEVEIVNTSGQSVFGLRIQADHCVIQGLIINQFYAQIHLDDADHNVIVGNYLGADPSGRAARKGQSIGVNVYFFSDYNRIGGPKSEERNVIVSGVDTQIRIDGSHTEVVGNYVGVSADGMIPLGFSFANIDIQSDNTRVINNVLANSLVAIQNANQTVLERNFIGTDPSGIMNYGSYREGIFIWNSTNTMIGPGNLIYFSDEVGVWIQGNNSISNRVTQNSISQNNDEGIFLFEGGNNDMPAPVLTYAFAHVVGGYAEPLATIEIFSDEEDEGKIYEGTVQANEAGEFTWFGTATGPNVTATATDQAGNTSPFSGPYLLIENPNYTYQPIIHLPRSDAWHLKK